MENWVKGEGERSVMERVPFRYCSARREFGSEGSAGFAEEVDFLGPGGSS